MILLSNIATFVADVLFRSVYSLVFFALTLFNITVYAQENMNTDILTMGDSITAGLAGDGSGVIRCASLGGSIVAADNQRSCRGNGQQNVGGWQPTLNSLTGSNTFNFGNSGETTAEMVRRFQTTLTSRRSKYVLILGGTNDVIANVSTAQILENIQTMVSQSRAANRVPVVGTIPPLLLGRFDSINNRVIELNTAIKNLNDIEIVDHYTALVDGWGVNNSGDTIHLSLLGNQLVAEGWAGAINQLNAPETNTVVVPAVTLLLED